MNEEYEKKQKWIEDLVRAALSVRMPVGLCNVKLVEDSIKYLKEHHNLEVNEYSIPRDELLTIKHFQDNKQYSILPLWSSDGKNMIFNVWEIVGTIIADDGEPLIKVGDETLCKAEWCGCAVMPNAMDIIKREMQQYLDNQQVT